MAFLLIILLVVPCVFANLPREYWAREGDQVRMLCNGTWEDIGGTPIKSDRTLTVEHKGVLLIQSLKKSNNYYCHSLTGDWRQHIVIPMFNEPRRYITNQVTIYEPVEPGKDVLLECPLAYAARWLLNGEPLPSSPRFNLVNSTLSQSALLIRNVSRNLNDYRFSCISPAKMYMVHFRIRFNNASAVQKVSLLMMTAGILCALLVK